MRRYRVEKWNKGMNPVADYGTYTDWADVKLIVKGYKLDEDIMRLFKIMAYTRKNSSTYYTVDIIDD